MAVSNLSPVSIHTLMLALRSVSMASGTPCTHGIQICHYHMYTSVDWSCIARSKHGGGNHYKNRAKVEVWLCKTISGQSALTSVHCNGSSDQHSEVCGLNILECDSTLYVGIMQENGGLYRIYITVLQKYCLNYGHITLLSSHVNYIHTGGWVIDMVDVVQHRSVIHHRSPVRFHCWD